MERLEDRCMLASSALALVASPVAVHSPVAAAALVAASPQAQATAKVTAQVASLASTTSLLSSSMSSALYNELLLVQSALNCSLSNLSNSGLPSCVQSALTSVLTNALNTTTTLLGLLSPTSNGIKHSTASSSPSKSGMSTTTSTMPSGLSIIVEDLQSFMATLQAIETEAQSLMSWATSNNYPGLAMLDNALVMVVSDQIDFLESIVSLLSPSSTS
jgi:hypothetical protein